LAGPASTSSSHDEDSLPPSLALATDDYLDESTSSSSSARRARKRRTIASMPTPRQVPTSLCVIEYYKKAFSGLVFEKLLHFIFLRMCLLKLAVTCNKMCFLCK
jgi:hypothetical protein